MAQVGRTVVVVVRSPVSLSSRSQKDTTGRDRNQKQEDPCSTLKRPLRPTLSPCQTLVGAAQNQHGGSTKPGPASTRTDSGSLLCAESSTCNRLPLEPQLTYPGADDAGRCSDLYYLFFIYLRHLDRTGYALLCYELSDD